MGKLSSQSHYIIRKFINPSCVFQFRATRWKATPAHQVLLKREAVQSTTGVARGRTLPVWSPPVRSFFPEYPFLPPPSSWRRPPPVLYVLLPASPVINFFCFRTPSSFLCFRFLFDDKTRARARSDERTIEPRLNRRPTLRLTKPGN